MVSNRLLRGKYGYLNESIIVDSFTNKSEVKRKHCCNSSLKKKTTSHKLGAPLFCIVSWWDYLMPCGMSARIDGLVSQLRKKGVEPELITPIFNQNYTCFSKREASIIKTLNLRWLWFSNIVPETIVKMLGIIIFFIFSFVILSIRFWSKRKRKCMIVQYQDIFSAPAAIFARALFRITVIGDDTRLRYKQWNPPFSWVLRAYETLVLKNTDFVVTSFKLDNILIKNLRKNRNVLFIPNGIKKEPTQPEVSKDLKSVIFVGNFVSSDNVKALDNVLYVAGKLEKFSDTRIHVVGGPMKVVSKLAKQKGDETINVDFLGRVSQERLDFLYKKASIGILPYFGTPKHTSQRIKALEYLSNGLLLVASPRAVDGFTGLKAGQHYILAKTCEVASAGREFVFQNYSWDKVAEPYLKLIEHLNQDCNVPWFT
jgi:glycosyltransferase involved in cell wall biosynthesis